MRIGVDYDDVLFDSVTSILDFHNSRYGTSHVREDLKGWGYEGLWGCSKEEEMRRVGEWYASPEHARTRVIQGAMAGVALLARAHELHLVTCRSEHTKEHVSDRIRLYFQNRLKGIHFAEHSVSSARSKPAVCRELGVELLIEDGAHNAVGAAELGIPVLLYDTPWNQNCADHELITRVHDWTQISALLQ